MDLHELFLSCRRGDLPRVKYLVEQKEIELNVRDKWDSTPLYYACLCGHKSLVKYLLDNGAKCEANTFDGERCLYGALTKEIKNLLKSYNMVSSRTMRRDLYDEFLRRLLEDAFYTDVVFVVQRESIPAHKSILSARSVYFNDMFHTKWRDRREIHLNNQLVLPWAFRSILQYLYTGHLEVHIKNMEDCKRLAKQCRLHELIEQMEDKVKKIASFQSTKLGVNVTTLCTEPNSEELQLHLGKLADMALPTELSNWALGELPFEPEAVCLFPDVCFVVEGHNFLCHKAFFCGRSDYFKVLLLDHFGELETSDDLPTLTLHGISVDVFIAVMYHIYQDNCQLNKELVYEVLCIADMYLLPGLKRQCAAVIGQYMDTENVISILRTARVYNLPRLQDQCAQYMAENLDEIIQREDFAALVQEDAAEVEMREETDTIDIIDEIRFHITNFVQTFSEVEEANEKLVAIDDLLEHLDLEG
ncbi:ankyrin repeat and BTB/POZ domain-containing protein 1-like [Liolophura sinensis]|uniref:ankyrin repeat and BTB/POZ domain-containing protein 1-like n=1 Tax=Liolophura sinensis TaxID=3198878 RepID=UPI0031585FF4